MLSILRKAFDAGAEYAYKYTMNCNGACCADKKDAAFKKWLSTFEEEKGGD